MGSGTGRPEARGYWYPLTSGLEVQPVDPALGDFMCVSTEVRHTGGPSGSSLSTEQEKQC